MSSLRLLKHPNSSSMFAQGVMCLKVPGASSEGRRLCHSSVSICSLLFSCFSSEFILLSLAITKHNPTPTYPCKHSVVVEGGWLDGGSVAPCHSTGQSYIQPTLNPNSTHLRWPMTYSNVNIVVLFGGFRHTSEFSYFPGEVQTPMQWPAR